MRIISHYAGLLAFTFIVWGIVLTGLFILTEHLLPAPESSLYACTFHKQTSQQVCARYHRKDQARL